MAVFVSMDKSVVDLDPGYVTFVCATNSKTYRYLKADAERVFAAHGFGAEDATSMLEMTAVNHEGAFVLPLESGFFKGFPYLYSTPQAPSSCSSSPQSLRARWGHPSAFCYRWLSWL